MRRMSANCFLCLLLMALLAGCQRSTPGQALRAQIAQIEQGIEQGQPDRLLDRLSDDFHGNDGMDRNAAGRLLKAQWLLNPQISVVLGPLDVQIDQGHARVEFTAALAGGRGRVFERAQVYPVQTYWRLEGDQWRLYRAQWGDGRSAGD